MTEKGYEIKEGTIVINRELTNLDIFLKDFIDILKKYFDYLVVSGFVSISTGRVRGTEDIDVLVEVNDNAKFMRMFEELLEKDFWCYQADEPKEAYEYVKKLNNIRFARKNELFPNIEFVPINVSKKAKYYEFTRPQKIRVDEFEFKIPPIEFEILYKEIVLAGKKDIEDARHLRIVYKDEIDESKIEDFASQFQVE